MARSLGFPLALLLAIVAGKWAPLSRPLQVSKASSSARSMLLPVFLCFGRLGVLAGPANSSCQFLLQPLLSTSLSFPSRGGTGTSQHVILACRDSLLVQDTLLTETLPFSPLLRALLQPLWLLTRIQCKQEMCTQQKTGRGTP